MGRCGWTIPLINFTLPTLKEVLWNMGVVLFSIAAWAINILYQIFGAVATAQLFNSEIIKEFSKRITMILGVVMFFVILINLLRMISDPNRLAGDGEGSGRDLAKGIIISLVLIVLINTIFSMAYEIQGSVIRENVLGRLFLGDVSSAGDSIESNNDTTLNMKDRMKNAGKDISIAILRSFIYIKPTEFVNDQPIMGIDKIGDGMIDGEIMVDDTNGNPTPIKLDKFFDNIEQKGFDELYLVSCSSIEHRVAFPWVLGLFTALVVIYIMIVYTIDLGIRVAKLGFYQLIAPIPIGFRAVPGKRDIFDNWKKETMGTFLEVFIRLAIIFFAITAINVLANVFKSSGGMGLWPDSANRPTEEISLFARAIILLGIVLFMKEAPKLLGDVFGLKAGGSDMGLGFAKLKQNLSPALTAARATKRVGGAAVGGAAAGIAGGINAWKNSRNQVDALGNPTRGGFRNFAGAALGGLGSVGGGMAEGFRRTKEGGILDAGVAGAGVGAGIIDVKEERRKRAKENGRTVFGQAVRDIMGSAGERFNKVKDDLGEEFQDARTRRVARSPQQAARDTQMLEAMNQITQNATRTAQANAGVEEAEKRAAQIRAEASENQVAENMAMRDLQSIEAQQVAMTAGMTLSELINGSGVNSFLEQKETQNTGELNALNAMLQNLIADPLKNQNEIAKVTAAKAEVEKDQKTIQNLKSAGQEGEALKYYIETQLKSNQEEKRTAETKITQLEQQKSSTTDQATIKQLEQEISFQGKYVAEIEADTSKLKEMKFAAEGGVIEFAGAELKNIDLSKGLESMKEIEIKATAKIEEYENALKNQTLTVNARADLELKHQGAIKVQAQVAQMKSAGVTMNTSEEMKKDYASKENEYIQKQEVIQEAKTKKVQIFSEMAKAEEIVSYTKAEAVRNNPEAAKGLEKMRELLVKNDNPELNAKLAQYGVDLSDLDNTLTADTLFKVQYKEGPNGERVVSERFEDVISKSLKSAQKVMENFKKNESSKPEKASTEKKEGGS